MSSRNSPKLHSGGLLIGTEPGRKLHNVLVTSVPVPTMVRWPVMTAGQACMVNRWIGYKLALTTIVIFKLIKIRK